MTQGGFMNFESATVDKWLPLPPPATRMNAGEWGFAGPTRHQLNPISLNKTRSRSPCFRAASSNCAIQSVWMFGACQPDTGTKVVFLFSPW